MKERNPLYVRRVYENNLSLYFTTEKSEEKQNLFQSTEIIFHCRPIPLTPVYQNEGLA
jgi:hypothetical protein